LPACVPPPETGLPLWPVRAGPWGCPGFSLVLGGHVLSSASGDCPGPPRSVSFSDDREGSPMSERVMLVCDVCGSPAQQSVTFRIGGRSLSQDLCATHLQELVRRSHAPRRGRRPGSVSPSGATAVGAGRRRRGGTESRAPETRAPAKRERKRITDPATLEKRRAALAKARKALAAKRAAAKKGG